MTHLVASWVHGELGGMSLIQNFLPKSLILGNNKSVFLVGDRYPFVGQGRNCRRNGSMQDWIDSGPDGSLDPSIIHSIGPTLPRSALRRQN
jgi:hypothetical protein